MNLLILPTLLFLGIGAYTVSTLLNVVAAKRVSTSLLTSARLILALGAILHSVLLVLIAADQHRFPISNLSEASLFLAILISFVSLALDAFRQKFGLILGAAPLATVIGLWASLLEGVGRAPENAHTLRFWTGLHVLLTLTAFAAFALTFVSGILYLSEQRRLKRRTSAPLLPRMPSLEGLYSLLRKNLILGVVLLTGGILIGYLHGRSLSPGDNWRLDPKVLITTITWGAYALLLVASFFPNFRGRRTALGAAISFALVGLTLWGGLFWSDFHKFV